METLMLMMSAVAAVTVKLERRLEAVFVSYALYGEWRPDEVGVWLSTGNECKGISSGKFLDLVRDTKLMTTDALTTADLREVFFKLNNPVSLSTPHCFIAIIAICLDPEPMTAET